MPNPVPASQPPLAAASGLPPEIPAVPATGDPVDRYFQISLFFLLLVGFLTLAGTGKMDLFTVILMTSALGSKAILLWRRSRFRLSPRLVLWITIVYIPYYLADFLFLVDSDSAMERLLLATIHLVFFTAAVKMLSEGSARDSVYLAALAFAQMLAAATLTVDTSFLLYFFLFLLLAISTFTSLEIKRARVRNARGGPPAPERFPQGRLPGALGGTSVVICAGTVFLSVLLFFVIPRGSGGYLSSLGRNAERITGFSDNVTLGEIGEIKKLSSVVMHVRSPDISPFEAVRWRGIGLAAFDGNRWSRLHNLPSKMVPGFRRRFQFAQDPFRPAGRPRRLRYTITLQPLLSDALFLASRPLEVTGPFRFLWEDAAGSVYARFRGPLIRYSAMSDTRTPSPALLQADTGDIPEDVREIYLQLPAVDPRVAELAAEVTVSQPTSYDKAKAVESYLQSSYGYTLELPSAMPADPIAYFLFDLRRGHCEFFASAMAVMLRSVGIPARLVNGFLQGSYNDISGHYTVRASDAHTWVEVFFPAYGWVTFDPTPAEGRSAQPALFGRVSIYLDALQAFWEEWVINYDFLHQTVLARQLERSTRQATVDSRAYFRRRYRDLVAAVKGGTERLAERRGEALLVILLVGGLLATLHWRRALALWVREAGMHARARQGVARPEDATIAYHRLLRTLARRGIHKPPGLTPDEFAASLTEPAASVVRDFTGLYVETRYGRVPSLLPRMNALLLQLQALRRPQ